MVHKFGGAHFYVTMAPVLFSSITSFRQFQNGCQMVIVQMANGRLNVIMTQFDMLV